MFARYPRRGFYHRRTDLFSGEGGIRTRDTTIFSRVLYQLSYLAASGES